MDEAQPTKVNPIIEAALKVCTREELQAMSDIPRRNMLHLIDRRLQEAGPPPTVPELEGIKELATVHLWHPSLDSTDALWR